MSLPRRRQIAHSVLYYKNTTGGIFGEAKRGPNE
jgi:hypothetical protein